jgi:RimJ/RimL family protein N-acetyltransferase
MTKLKSLQRYEFVDSDFERLKLRPEDKDRGFESIRELTGHGVAFSYFDGSKIVGCTGVVRINDNTCEVWIILDHCAKQYIREIYRHAFAFLDRTQQFFVRIQAIVRTDWPTAHRFIERLGFQKEGMMRKFGPDGSDYYLYARVK